MQMDRERAEQRRAWLAVALMIVLFVWALIVNHMLSRVLNAAAAAQAAGEVYSVYWSQGTSYEYLAYFLMVIQMTFGHRLRRITDYMLFHNNASWDGLREFSGGYGTYLKIWPIIHVLVVAAQLLRS
jgi:squalene cyclase